MESDDYGSRPDTTSDDCSYQSVDCLSSVSKGIGEMGILDRFFKSSSLGSTGMVFWNVVLFGLKPYLFRNILGCS